MEFQLKKLYVTKLVETIKDKLTKKEQIEIIPMDGINKYDFSEIFKRLCLESNELTKLIVKEFDDETNEIHSLTNIILNDTLVYIFVLDKENKLFAMSVSTIDMLLACNTLINYPEADPLLITNMFDISDNVSDDDKNKSREVMLSIISKAVKVEEEVIEPEIVE